MSNYIPPDAHNVVLNFKNVSTGSTDLNFGADEQNLASIDVFISTAFISQIHAETSENNSLDVVINTAFSAEINALSGQLSSVNSIIKTGFIAEIKAVVIDQYCALDSEISARFDSLINAQFDINFNKGVDSTYSLGYQLAKTCLNTIGLTWGKPIFRAHNDAFYFEKGLTLSNQVLIGFDKTNTLYRSIQLIHEQATGLSSCSYLKWQENERLFISRNLVFEESDKLKINHIFDWVELVRKRKNFTFSHEVAHVFEKTISFDWDKGLELITTNNIVWEKAKAIHYRKHSIEPLPKPEIPKYSGSTDLNFICLCHDVDAHNVILNFGADDCIPSIPNKNWWYILNSLEVSRLDNGQKINVLDGSYNTDRSRWCWSYSLTVPASEIEKLEPIDGKPVVIKIVVNGNEHHMLLENRSRSRRFAQDTYNLSGRSQSALLDAPSAPTRSFLQENERTSVQLAQAELDRVNSQALLNWKLIDDLGWILPINSLSYSNLTPIAAIKLIVESAGGFIYSEKNSNTLSIKPKYKKTFWDSLAISDYDRLVPISLVKDQSTDYELYPDYNGITLTNDQSGLTGQVKRTGTSSDTLLETVNSSLFVVESMGAFGKSQLAKAGMVETHTLSIPISSEVGECLPGEIVAFNADWWGVIDSVSVSFNYASVNQTIKVEMVNRNE